MYRSTVSSMVWWCVVMMLATFVLVRSQPTTPITINGNSRAFVAFDSRTQTSPPMQNTVLDPTIAQDDIPYPNFCYLGRSSNSVDFEPSIASSFPNPIPGIILINGTTDCNYNSHYDFICIKGTLTISSPLSVSGIIVLEGGKLIINQPVTFEPFASVGGVVDFNFFQYFPGIVSYGGSVTVNGPVNTNYVATKNTNTTLKVTLPTAPNPSDEYLLVTSTSVTSVPTPVLISGSSYSITVTDPLPAIGEYRVVLNKNQPFLIANISTSFYFTMGSQVTINGGISVKPLTKNQQFNDWYLDSQNNTAGGSNPRLRGVVTSAYGSTVTLNQCVFDGDFPTSRALVQLHHGKVSITGCLFNQQAGSIVYAEYGTEVITSSNNIYFGKPASGSFNPVPNNLDFYSAGSAIYSVSPHVSSSSDAFFGSFPGGAIVLQQLPDRTAATGYNYDLHLSDNTYRKASVNQFITVNSAVNLQSVFQLSNPNHRAIIINSNVAPHTSVSISSAILYNPIEVNNGGVSIAGATINTQSGVFYGSFDNVQMTSSYVTTAGPLTTSSHTNALLALAAVYFSIDTDLGTAQVTPGSPVYFVNYKFATSSFSVVPSPVTPQEVSYGGSLVLSAQWTQVFVNATCYLVETNSGKTIANLVPSVNVNLQSCSFTWTPVEYDTVNVFRIVVNTPTDSMLKVQLPTVYVSNDTLTFRSGWDLGSSGNSTVDVNGLLYFQECSDNTSCSLTNTQTQNLPSGLPTAITSTGIYANGGTPSVTLLDLVRGLYKVTLYFSYYQVTVNTANPLTLGSFMATVNGNPINQWTPIGSSSNSNGFTYTTIQFYYVNVYEGDSIEIAWVSNNVYMTGVSTYAAEYITPEPPRPTPSAPTKKSSFPIVAVVIPVAAIVLVAIIVIAALVTRRRNNNKYKKEGIRGKGDVELNNSKKKLTSSGSGNGSSGALGSSGNNVSSGNLRPIPHSPSRTALKTSTAFNSDKYRLHPDIYTVIQDSQFYSVEHAEFPLTFSLTRLDFGMGGMKCQIDQQIQDSIIVVNKSQKQVSFKVLVPPSSSAALIDCDAEDSIVLKPGKSITVNFSLRLLCTTKLMERIAVDIAEFGHTFIYMAVESVLSTQLDYDELVFYEPPIGEGSFGVVYKGSWRGQEVAIKKLKIGHLMGGNQELINDVYREMDLMNKLRHPNIVSYVGAVKTSDKLCLVSEYVPMGSLAKVLYKEKRVLTLKEKVRIALDTAKGCNFLHQCGIMHRDLKPDNILVVTLATDAQICVKLTDFGTSKEVTDFDLSSYTAGLGTPIYMANEILEKQAYDNSADVYSYAVMFYELIIGCVPFGEFKNIWEIPRFILSGKRPTAGLENVYPPIVELINECWNHEPAKRPTFAQIIPRLEQIFNDVN